MRRCRGARGTVPPGHGFGDNDNSLIAFSEGEVKFARSDHWWSGISRFASLRTDARKSWDVLCLDNLVTGNESNISHLIPHPRFRFAHQDVSRYIEVQGPVEAVLHFASPASPPDYLKFPIQTLKVGALGTHNTLGLALAKKAKFFLASTRVLWRSSGEPAAGDILGACESGGSARSVRRAKRYAEAMSMAYHRYHGLDTRIVRIFNTYGPRMRLNDGRALPNFLYQALSGEPITVYGDGKQTRSFCYVSDLLAGIYKLLESNEHEPTNIGNPQEITILEFAERVRALVGPMFQSISIRCRRMTPSNDVRISARPVAFWLGTEDTP